MGWTKPSVLSSNSNFPPLQSTKHLQSVSILSGILPGKVKGMRLERPRPQGSHSLCLLREAWGCAEPLLLQVKGYLARSHSPLLPLCDIPPGRAYSRWHFQLLSLYWLLPSPA